MEEEEESIPQFESEFDDDQGDEADGWIPSTDAEIEEQVSLSCAEDGGPFSIKIEVPGHVDSDNEESAGHSESEEETENEQDQCEEANTDEGLNERFCESAFAQELSEDRKGISNGGNDPQSCSTSSGTKNIINSSMEDVSTQHQQVNLSTAELHQFNAEIQPGQGRIHRAIEAQMHPKEHGVLPTEEFSILKNILEGNNSSRNVTINSTNCPVCGQGFASPGDLDIHLKIHIQKSGNTSQDSAKNLPSINSHSHQKKVNTKKQFKCDSCDKLYASAKSLKRHQLLHSDNKQFKCRFCGKEFLSKNHLARHERVHTGEKPFECKYCLKKFSQKASLVGHEMVHTGEKPFTCRFCGKKFVQKISLIRHERIHTGEKPFKCKFCEKRFVQESNLICHERVHTNERPHSCNHCDKKFGRKYDLIKHEEIHAREIPFRMFASSILQNLIKTHTTA